MLGTHMSSPCQITPLQARNSVPMPCATRGRNLWTSRAVRRAHRSRRIRPPAKIGAVSLLRRRTQRAGHAHDMLGHRPQLASLLVEELRIDAGALHELRMRPDFDDSPAIEHHDHRAIPCPCYGDVLEASRWPSVRPTGGATITVSPPSRPLLTSTPRSNSRPVRIGTCLATPSRTTQT